MGLCVSFHPIHPDEMKRFVFEPIENRELLESRIDELAKKSEDPEAADFLREAYNDFFDEITNEKGPLDGQLFTFFMATIASFLHPYWCPERNSLSQLIQMSVIDNFFTSIAPLASGKISKRIRHQDLILNCNWTATGYADPASASDLYQKVLQAIKNAIKMIEHENERLARQEKSLLSRIKKMLGIPAAEPEYYGADVLDYLKDLSNEQDKDNDFLLSLKGLNQYCIEHNLGFIEATDANCLADPA